MHGTVQASSCHTTATASQSDQAREARRRAPMPLVPVIHTSLDCTLPSLAAVRVLDLSHIIGEVHFWLKCLSDISI